MVKYSRLKHFFFLSLISLLLLNSCGSYTKNALFQSASDIDPETIKDVYVINDQGEEDIYYKIKINDVISINNLQNIEWGGSKTATTAPPVNTNSTENITTYRVDLDGTVNLPAIGKILIAGLTRREATAKLQDRYGNVDYLKNPIIELNIVNLKVLLLGEFSKQGNFLLTKDNTTLFEIIGEAGGFTKVADPRTLKIIRGNRSNPEIIHVNLNDIKSLASKKIILQNNDIIYIYKTKNAVFEERIQKSNNLIQPLLVAVNLAILIFTLTK